MMTEEEARKRVKEIRGFYGHLSSYVVVNTGLFLMNMVTSPGANWFVFPMIGWGIGLLSHALRVFPLFGKGADWEERKVQELMQRSGGYVSASKLENILDERMTKLSRNSAVVSGNDPVMKKLIQRLEHLEAIVTSKDWDNVETFSDRKPDVELPADDRSDELLSTEEKVQRLARKVK